MEKLYTTTDDILEQSLTDIWAEKVIEKIPSSTNKAMITFDTLDSPFIQGMKVLFKRVQGTPFDTEGKYASLWERLASEGHEVFILENHTPMDRFDTKNFSTKVFGVIVEKKFYPTTLGHISIQKHLTAKGVLKKQLNKQAHKL